MPAKGTVASTETISTVPVGTINSGTTVEGAPWGSILSTTNITVDSGTTTTTTTTVGATPTFVNKGTVSESTTTGSPGLPASMNDDDVMILAVQTDTEAVTAPSGWTELSVSPVQFSTTTRISLFYRRYVSGDTAPTIADPGDHLIAQIYAFRGCKTTGEPFSASATGTFAGTTSITLDCGVTSLANQLICVFLAGGADNTVSRFESMAGTNASLTSINHRAAEGTDLGAGGSIDLWTGVKAAAGDCGDLTGTIAIASAGAYITIALSWT
jgi:hypothetical protein